MKSKYTKIYYACIINLYFFNVKFNEEFFCFKKIKSGKSYRTDPDICL